MPGSLHQSVGNPATTGMRKCGAEHAEPQAYSAMLLGFIVADDAALRSQAAAALPGGSLALVAAAVEQCLQFYVAVGAMPADNERSLRQLVASLRQQL